MEQVLFIRTLPFRSRARTVDPYGMDLAVSSITYHAGNSHSVARDGLPHTTVRHRAPA